MLKVGEAKEVKVMLLDNDGNPTAGTITYIVYDENDTSFATGTMTATVTIGLYTMTFTPDVAGAWSVLVKCLSPNRTAVKVFDVGVGVEQDTYDAVVLLDTALATHDSDIKTLLSVVQADLDSPDQYKADVSALALEATLTAIKGGGWTDETLKAIKDAVDAIAGGGTPPADIWSYATRTLTDPNSYKADVSALALEASLGTHDTDIKALIGALNDITAGSVWTVGTRTLTDPDSYKADISALALEATLGTHDSDIKALLSTIQTDLDNPAQYKADVSALALEATLATHDSDIKALLSTVQSQTQIDVSWTKGDGAEKTMVRRKIGSYPDSVSDGDQAYFDTGVSFNDTGLVCGTHYYYRAWSYKTGAPNSGYSDEYSEDEEWTLSCGVPSAGSIIPLLHEVGII